MSLQEKSLFMAMELSNKKWKLVFGDGSRERERKVRNTLYSLYYPLYAFYPLFTLLEF